MSVNQNWLIFRLGNEIGLIAVLGSKKRSFYVGDPNCLSFSVAIEVDLVLERGVEVGFIFVCWPKVTWFQCKDRNWLSVLRGDLTWLGFLGGTKLSNFFVWGSIDLVQCGWSKLNCFLWVRRKRRLSGGFENSLNFVGVVKIDLVSVCGIDIELILVQGPELTYVFCVGGRNTLGFHVGASK